MNTQMFHSIALFEDEADAYLVLKDYRRQANNDMPQGWVNTKEASFVDPIELVISRAQFGEEGVETAAQNNVPGYYIGIASINRNTDLETLLGDRLRIVIDVDAELWGKPEIAYLGEGVTLEVVQTIIAVDRGLPASGRDFTSMRVQI